MTNVLFIIHDNYQDSNQFPLGPAYLASVLEQNGYTVEVYCMDVFHYTNDDLANKLKKDTYDLIGLDFMAARYTETIVDLCKVINKHKGNAKFILGGHGPSPIPIYMLMKTNADIVAIGEAEETIIDVMKYIHGLMPIDDVKGIAYRDNNHIHITQKRELIKKLDTIPFPAWHLFPMDKYTTSTRTGWMEKDERYIAIITSRGCINTCTFCARLTEGIRLRNLNKVIEEMKVLEKEYGVTCFNISDELFLISKKRALKFCELLKENNMKIKFSAGARADVLDEETAIALKEAGCGILSVGFESSSQDSLDYMKKNTTVEDNIRTLEISRKVGLPVALNFIWGYPTDTYEILMDNVKIINEYNQFKQLRTIRPVTPYPGCELYYEAIFKGLLQGPDDFFTKFKNSDLITVNFTRYSDKQCYEWLFEANKKLIEYHYEHTDMTREECDDLINQFYNLYFKGFYKFRGARRYETKR